MSSLFLLLIGLVVMMGIIISLVLFLALRFVDKTSFFFQKLFSNFEYIPKRHFYMAEFYDEVYNYLAELEFENNVRLSHEAKQLLILPLLEFRRLTTKDSGNYLYNKQEFGGDIEFWRQSLTKIIESMKSDPAQIDKYENEIRMNDRSSLSVIKAFSSKFCNIPPFCGER